MLIEEKDYLIHYGILRKSGRYPWGSGETPFERSNDFLGTVAALRKQGMSDTDIAKAFSTDESPFTTTMLRATTSIARNQSKAASISQAQRLKDKGYSNSAIAQRMGLPGESSVRALLAPGAEVRNNELTALSGMLKSQVAEKGFIDVGVGVERYSDSSRTKFDTALSMLKAEDYHLINVQVDQPGGGDNKTTIKVLAPPGKTDKEYYAQLAQDKSLIKPIDAYSEDGLTFTKNGPPVSLNSSRLAIRYADQGGTEADGVMYIRPGVKDLDMGGSQYAQVRIAVDGTHYIKGMAVYKDDLPEGVDVMFNTNKSDTGNKLDALKEMKTTADGKLDPDLPFGSTIKPGGQRGVLNIVNEEGDWNDWSKSLASQMLSKQKPALAKEQLDKTYSQKKQELDEISSLNNPAIKQRLLQSFADDADSSSVHLKAAAMPRQATQVILPAKSLKETEIFAPNFNNGERVALVRYPHGGTFEIPELTVNNKNQESKDMIGTSAKDAVVINPKVAERLSGADFDGDTVLVIPNDSGKIKSTPALEGLKDFDPKVQYKAYDGMKPMTPKQKQTEMGKVSNLITDMTIKDANTQEIARAVRHSMVVIDAEKHKLNYKQSYIDNGIAQLKEKYQGGKDKGASTLISRSTSEVQIPKQKRTYSIDPDTGKKIFTPTGESYTNSKGKTVVKTQSSTKGAEAEDAHSLSSGTPVEEIYADHSNKMKALGNTARKEMVATRSTPYSPSAAKVYSDQVASLNSKLNVALKNAPRERQAQIVANTIVKAKKDSNPDMTPDEVKKISGKALTEARTRTGAGKTLVDITDDEWDAIQAGAISTNKLKQILNNTNLDRVKELATPRKATVMTEAKVSTAQSLLASGKTMSEVATILGIPRSTIESSLKSK